MDHSILTLNAGSSSIKFALFVTSGKALQEQVRGQLGGLGAAATLSVRDASGHTDCVHDWGNDAGPSTVHDALALVLQWITQSFPRLDVIGVGHRIVHGGPHYAAPVLLDEDILVALRRLSPLAPLHQPHNLSGVEAAQALFPHTPQIGCFDTAFHRGHPWINDVYALPRHYRTDGIRRYGFHGLSYEYLLAELRRIAPEQAERRVLMAHLGNGASLCAILNGQSVDCSMGFSVLDGLPMGTRCGHIDPGVLLYLMQERKLSPERLADLLYHQSGLKGMSGLSNDLRTLETSSAPEAVEAIDYFAAQIRKGIGGSAAVLGGLDTLVFSGGIGENSSRVRERVLNELNWLGIEFDPDLNARHNTLISTAASRCPVYVIKTNEELMIARHVNALLGR